MTQKANGPAMFRCIMCNKFFDRSDIIWSHKAEQFDGATCICEACVPAWKEKINPPALEQVEDVEKHESFISHYLHHVHDRRIERQRERTIEKVEDDFATFIMASLEDPPLASILKAMASLGTGERGKLIDSMIGQIEHKETPQELLVVLHNLKKDDVAAKVLELLEGHEKKG